MHHLGSEGYKKDLTEELQLDVQELQQEKVDISGLQSDDYYPFEMRLGLSATPWDAYDDARNQYIADGFINGEFKIKSKTTWQDELIDEKRVFYFGLKEGIEKGILCPFDYEPLPYVPSEQDFEDAKEAFGKVRPDLPPHKKKIMGMILAAKVFKKSREKFPPFKKWLTELIESGEELDRSILFVADKSFGKDLDNILSSEFLITDFRTFFQGEKMDTLEKFAIGKTPEHPEGLDSLIACERISEGLDIKSVDTIVLFCSDNSRLKTIQRIGRALRTDDEHPDKIATVVDFTFKEEGNADSRREDWLTELSKVRRKEK
jgi:superfamily II DNA or RNA helicase